MIKNKLVFFLILLLVAVNFLSAEEAHVTFQKTGETVKFTISENLALRAIADSINMPVKKLKAMLATELKLYGESHPDFKGIQPQNREWDVIPIQELNIQPAKVAEMFNSFTKNTLNYGYSVTLVGIIVVFLSLLLISILINQFQHIEKTKALKAKRIAKKSTSTIETSAGKITGPSDAISSNAIVAVISALHKHKLSVEERVKIQMTFSRTPVNMWSASAKMDMPNRVYTKPTDRSKK